MDLPGWNKMALWVETNRGYLVAIYHGLVFFCDLLGWKVMEKICLYGERWHIIAIFRIT